MSGNDVGAAAGADKGALNVRRPVRVGPGSGDQQIPDGALLKRPESSSSRSKQQRGVVSSKDLAGCDVAQRQVRKHGGDLDLRDVDHLILA